MKPSEDVWIFDLDNTLYDCRIGLVEQIEIRMREYIASALSVSSFEAVEIEKKIILEYGTTLFWVRDICKTDPGCYLNYVHDIDYNCVMPDQELILALGDLMGRKIIYTNGTYRHALATLGRLGLNHLFDEIYDIKSTGYNPKHTKAAFQNFLSHAKIPVDSTTMLDDLRVNLKVAKQSGLRTVLIDPFNVSKFKEDYFIDHISDSVLNYLISRNNP